jgi:hypothetical protein
MGDYTTYKKLYKPLPPEFVNVDQHLNYNLDIIDTYSKRILNITPTDVPNIATDALLTKEPAFKWYKTYSNSIWIGSDLGGTTGSSVGQPVGSEVLPWTIFTAFNSEWSSNTITPVDHRLAYRVSPADNTGAVKIEWRGRAYKTNQDMPSKSNLLVGTLSAQLSPLQFKAFMCPTGDSTGNPSIARLSFNAGQILCNHQGGHIGNLDVYVDFAGITYTVNP